MQDSLAAQDSEAESAGGKFEDCKQFESSSDDSHSSSHKTNESSQRASHETHEPDCCDEDMARLGDEDLQHITMSVTMDVSDMDTEDIRVLKELANLYEDSFREVIEKNRDYSWSFLKTGAKLAQSDGVPFDDVIRSQVFGLLTRTGDKRERIVENVYGDGSATVSDSPGTTAAECANYYLFLSFILDNPDLAVEVSQ